MKRSEMTENRAATLACAYSSGTMSNPLANLVAMSQSETKQPQNEELPHSVYGVISLNLALCAILLPFVLTIICACIGLDAAIISTRVIVGVGLVCMSCIGIAAFTLGIIGVCQSRTRKVFSILGIIFASISLLFPFVHFIYAILVAMGRIIESAT